MHMFKVKRYSQWKNSFQWFLIHTALLCHSHQVLGVPLIEEGKIEQRADILPALLG